MKITLQELIEDISYAAITVTIETPIVRSDFAMGIDHIVNSDNGYYIEGDNGCSVEILYGTDIEKTVSIHGGDATYFIEKSDCTICIKLDK